MSQATIMHEQDEGPDQYHLLLRQLCENFGSAVGAGAPLFTTDAAELFSVFLDALPPEHRQTYTCHACKHFVRRFGGLVTIAEDGATASACWREEGTPDLFLPSIRAMLKAIRRAKVTGVFLTREKLWGLPITGEWHHLAVQPPAGTLYRGTVLDPGQAMAEKREDRKNVCRALGEFSPELVTQAVAILEADALYRSEKVLGPAKWLSGLHQKRAELKGPSRDNVVWLAVATAPAGFCHPRASMIGSLLEDLVAGMPFDVVKQRFAGKMHPLLYQRPQAAPTMGAIAQAEKLVEQPGIAPSLRRRFAKLEDVQALWKPEAPKPAEASDGVFSHLVPKGQRAATAIDVPSVVMTWDKLRRTILPEALAIEFKVPFGHANFAALLTACDPDAPPILQWDIPGRRNPVSWYLYHGGSPATQWNLTAGSWCAVTAVTLQPPMWSTDENAFKHQGRGVLFLLTGARDSRDGGLALFPEILKAELHGVRSVIEAHSHTGHLDGREDATACGLILQAGDRVWSGASFRVSMRSGLRQTVALDRWD